VTGDDLPEDGFYTYEYFDRYWDEPGRFPFLIQVDGKVAGFVLARISRDEAGVDTHHIAEFFVMRKYRRQKVGQAAARMIFDAFPGAWRVSQIPENLPAQAFWRKVIGEYTQGKFAEAIDPEDGDIVQTFRSGGQTQVERT
jgi:predicted acetyltransferase